MTEIIIKFPKQPKTIQRKKAQEIAKKFDYKEDDFFSIVKFDRYNEDLYFLLNIIRWFKNIEITIGGEIIGVGEFKDICENLHKKLSPVCLDWYYDYGIIFNSESNMTFENLKEYLLGDIFGFQIERLESYNILCFIKENLYKVEKEKIKILVSEKSKIIKKLSPEFDENLAIKFIEELPEEIKIKNNYEEINLGEDNKTKEIEGEEWVDWYSPVKFCKEVLDLLKKIESNTKSMKGGIE